MKTLRRWTVLTIDVKAPVILWAPLLPLLLLACSSTSGSEAASEGSCLEPGYACSAGQICCTGADDCPAGKCAPPTTVECRSYSGCAACAAEPGCAYCQSTGACLDEFGQQGPDWDTCANLAIDPSSCTAPSSSSGGTTSSSGTGGTTASCNCAGYTMSTPVCENGSNYFVCGTRQVCADTLADACESGDPSSSGGASSSGTTSSGGTGVSSSGSSGTTGSSSGGATCPSGYPVDCTTFCCPSGTVCCAGSTCSSTGSCPSSTGTTSSGGGGTSCTDLNSCVSATSQTAASGTSCTGAELYGTLTNNCGQAAYCRVCPVVNGAVYEAGCGASGIQAGQTESGEGAGWWWCEGTEIKYLCSASSDPSSCVQF